MILGTIFDLIWGTIQLYILTVHFWLGLALTVLMVSCLLIFEAPAVYARFTKEQEFLNNMQKKVETKLGNQQTRGLVYILAGFIALFCYSGVTSNIGYILTIVTG